MVFATSQEQSWRSNDPDVNCILNSFDHTSKVHSRIFDSTRLVLVIFLFLGIVIGLNCQGEPSWHGKPASFWLERFHDFDHRNEAITAFKGMGTNAVPFLIDVLQEKSSRLGQLVDEEIEKYDQKGKAPDWLKESLPSKYRAEERKQSVFEIIEKMGPKAWTAIPILFEIYQDTNNIAPGWTGFAEEALLSMDEKLAGHVPQFIGWLNDTNLTASVTPYRAPNPDRYSIGPTRMSAALFLGSVGPKAKLAVPFLLKSGDNSDWGLASASADALWKIDRQTNAVIRILTNALSNPPTQHDALWRLNEVGAPFKAAATAIQPLLYSNNEEAGDYAENTLRKLDPILLVSTLREMNKDSAVHIQKMIATLAQADTNVILPKWDFDKEKALKRAYLAIRIHQAAAKDAVPALISILKSPKNCQLFYEAGEVADALGAIGPDARMAVPALVNRLDKGNDAFYRNYCNALEQIGPAAAEAIPVLTNFFYDSDKYSILAVAAVCAIASKPPAEAIAILKMVRVEKQYIDDLPFLARITLWKIHLEPAPPVNDLIAAIKKEAPPGSWGTTAERLVYLLGRIGPNARPALPLLSEMLSTFDFCEKRRAAAVAITQIDREEAAKLGLPGIFGLP